MLMIKLLIIILICQFFLLISCAWNTIRNREMLTELIEEYEMKKAIMNITRVVNEE